VALAGGTAYAEGEVAENKIDSWRPFGKLGFFKTVQQGRNDLALGWDIFSFMVIGQFQASIPPIEPLS